MAGKIPIDDAKRIARERNCPVVIIFGIAGPDGETFEIATYGETKKLCRHAADLGKQFAMAVFDGTVTPSAIEPKHLPDEPTQWDAKVR